MNERETIDISGIDKAALLVALFNNSAPGGMGFLQAGFGPTVMTVDDARQVIASEHHDPGAPREGLSYDYLFGRPLKSDISGDSYDPWGYDRDNGGPGTAAGIIEKLRTQGTVTDPETEQRSHDLAMTRAHEAMAMANTQTQYGEAEILLGGSDIGDVLEKAVDREVDRRQ